MAHGHLVLVAACVLKAALTRLPATAHGAPRTHMHTLMYYAITTNDNLSELTFLSVDYFFSITINGVELLRFRALQLNRQWTSSKLNLQSMSIYNAVSKTFIFPDWELEREAREGVQRETERTLEDELRNQTQFIEDVQYDKSKVILRELNLKHNGRLLSVLFPLYK